MQLLRDRAISDSAIQIINNMLQIGENNRPSCLELLSSGYFSEIVEKNRLLGMEFVDKLMLQNLKDFSVNSLMQREIIGEFAPFSDP